MKKTLSIWLGASIAFASLAFVLALPALATTPSWDATGNYVVTIEYQGSNYSHDMTLIQNEDGKLTGNGGSPAGNNTHLWTIQDGTVSGDSIEFAADYTATPDAVTPQTTMDIEGTIASDGTMSGIWSDNYNGEDRSGTWTTASGTVMQHQTDDSTTVTVTIEKFIQGTMATAVTANSADFPMTAMWDAENTGAGNGAYALSETNDTPYQVVTTEMNKGADYETSELLDGDVVGSECVDGKPFALEGYSYGNTKEAAIAATPSLNTPSFTDLQHDKFIIVWNRDCSLPEGQISGTVIASDGILEVTSVEMINTTATANGSFTDGWEYVFHITAPTSEEYIAMKFNDWLRTEGAGTIPVAGNMRISSLQADNGGATILLSEANTYSSPDLRMIEDLNPAMNGRQVEITVEVAVPNGTPSGTYTTSYGVRANQ